MREMRSFIISLSLLSLVYTVVVPTNVSLLVALSLLIVRLCHRSCRQKISALNFVYIYEEEEDSTNDAADCAAGILLSPVHVHSICVLHYFKEWPTDDTSNSVPSAAATTE